MGHFSVKKNRHHIRWYCRYTYSDVSCVYYDVTSEKSAHLWNDVISIGPFVGIGLFVGPSLVVILTYIRMLYPKPIEANILI